MQASYRGECTFCAGTVVYAGAQQNPEKGEVLNCTDCGIDLEITTIEPPSFRLKFQEAPKVQEDWGE